MELEERVKELEGQVESLQNEKQALLSKRDQLLAELKSVKEKYRRFSDYADRDDIDIATLLDIKAKHEAGDNDAKSKYEAAYNADKTKFEARLAAIEKERADEKTQAEKERQDALNSKLKADAIAEFSKESYRIRNPQQFWQLFGEGKIQRGEDGKLFIGDEYKKTSLSDYIAQINEDADNSHHFKPRGGTGSGTGAGNGGSGGKVDNPWAKDSFNLTKQGQIIKTNPELAARLKAEAGVK